MSLLSTQKYSDCPYWFLTIGWCTSYVSIWLCCLRHYRNEKKLVRVNFREDFWDCYGQGKNWPIAALRVPSNDSRNNCGTHFGSPLLSKVYQARFLYAEVEATVWRRESLKEWKRWKKRHAEKNISAVTSFIVIRGRHPLLCYFWPQIS